MARLTQPEVHKRRLQGFHTDERIKLLATVNKIMRISIYAAPCLVVLMYLYLAWHHVWVMGNIEWLEMAATNLLGIVAAFFFGRLKSELNEEN